MAEGREILPGDVTEADFSAYISSANAAISPFDLEIRSSAHQETGERIYGLINSTSDAMTQLATPFTPDEISFVKRVLDAIFETNNTSRHEILAIQPKQATRLAKAQSNRRESEGAAETQGSTGQGITQLQADKVLKSLVEQGWFEKSRKNYYSLTPRALMELRGWLMETYNEDDESEGEGSESRPLKVKLCYACKEIITYVSPPRWAMNRMLIAYRAKDVLSEVVNADYTIFVREKSSMSRRLANVPFAKQIGRERITWAKEQQLTRADIKPMSVLEGLWRLRMKPKQALTG